MKIINILYGIRNIFLVILVLLLIFAVFAGFYRIVQAPLNYLESQTKLNEIELQNYETQKN